MKFLFVIPPSMGRYWKPSTPHVGIGYLSEILTVNGHKNKTIEMRLNNNKNLLFENINSFKPQYIGITGASLHYREMYQLINEIKETYPDIKVIVGGSHASIMKEHVLQYSKADLVVYGEGEQTILEIAQNRPFSKITGVIYRKRGEIIINPPRQLITDVDSLPFPKFKGVKLNQYLEHKIPLYTARGCPMECTFCAARLILGRGFRMRSPENVIAEIKYWYKRGYKEFSINDDEYTCIAHRTEKICDLLIKNKIKARFELRTGIRVDMINEQMLKKMKKAGFQFYAFGIESGDQKVLDMVKKHITIPQVRKAIKMVNKNGLQTSGFFMTGLPGETFKRFEKSLKLAKELNLNEVRFYNTIPYPGTELYDWVLKNGRFLHSPEEYLNSMDRWQREPVFETEEFPAEERRKAYDLGEQLFFNHLIKKTLGEKLSKPFIYLSKNNLIRRLLLNIGFRSTKLVRKFKK